MKNRHFNFKSMVSLRRTKLSVLIFLALHALAAKADRDCAISLNTPAINLTWDVNFTSQPITFTVNKANNRACAYVVSFSKGGASDYNRRMTNGPYQLRYQLYKEASLVNILKEWPETTNPNEVLLGAFTGQAGLTQNLTYYFAIPASEATTPTLKAAGIYTDSYIMKIYDSDNHRSSVPDTTSLVTVTTTIPKIIQISLVGPGGAFDANSTYQYLNFGSLTPGATRSLDLKVLSNAGYNVTFTSQNNGSLRHNNSSVTTTIPYTAKVNGAVYNLTSTPVLVAGASGQTTTTGSNNSVVFTIGDMPEVIAGSYSDTITVTATTRE